MEDNRSVDVRFLNREFDSIQDQLINFAEAYYPDTVQDFSEGSVGLMYIDMASYVGDVLSFYTDVQFKENFIQFAEERKNVFQLANELGYRPKTTRPATTNIDVFAVVPAQEVDGQIEPDFTFAPTIRENMVVSSESRPDVRFRTLEEIDFQADTAASPREIQIFEEDQNTGLPASYLVTKQVRAAAGTIETTTFDFGDPEAFPRRVLPDEDVIQVLSVTDSEGNEWFEVPFLAQERIFEEFRNEENIDPQLSQFSDSVPFLINARRESRRFTVRARSDGRTFLQFGSGVTRNSDEELVPNPLNIGNPQLSDVDQLDLPLDPANFLSVETFGRAPFDTTLEVEYVVGGGAESNVPINDLTNIVEVEFDVDQTLINNSENQQTVENIQNSVRVTNPVPATGGGPEESVEEIRRNAQGFFAAQNRIVTQEDYITRVLSMPERYGSIAKVTVEPDVIRDNPLAVNLVILGKDANGQLVRVNDAVKENVRQFISEFRMLTDAINIQDGNVINIAVDFEIAVSAGASARKTKLRAIQQAQSTLSTENREFNQPIVIGDIISDLNSVEGVQSVRELEFENRFDPGKGYSGNRYDIDAATRRGVIFPSQDPSVFELRFPNRDVRARTS